MAVRRAGGLNWERVSHKVVRLAARTQSPSHGICLDCLERELRELTAARHKPPSSG
ncbi:MAG: hypothetical protein AVDCRST_MAG77-3942 [uncultured Chloroflexi bacterium]|uniref:Uncharacterized protein n=1 Tax=uncultured Chloroflexota bacterium TaxID=166587 RepID=A0A6J4JMT5_9CHLR|nr:MAG: hypothetical protein AVDCRST_MAG77-3942 [uncultured Chloroflexota bacterium]